jgi:hypothetical protein
MILLAALVSLLSSRVFQPYAFSGTSFFTLGLNREWLDGLKSLAQQSTGNVDFPQRCSGRVVQLVFRSPTLSFGGLASPSEFLAAQPGCNGVAGIIKRISRFYLFGLGRCFTCSGS